MSMFCSSGGPGWGSAPHPELTAGGSKLLVTPAPGDSTSGFHTQAQSPTHITQIFFFLNSLSSHHLLILVFRSPALKGEVMQDR